MARTFKEKQMDEFPDLVYLHENENTKFYRFGRKIIARKKLKNGKLGAEKIIKTLKLK